MHKVRFKDFEALVQKALNRLPEKFRQELDNVVITIEDWPDQQTLEETGLGKTGLLFGLFQGTPKTKRSKSTVFPDKIVLFRGPIMAVSTSKKDMELKINQVLKHEIAHHFGLDESAIRKTGN